MKSQRFDKAFNQAMEQTPDKGLIGTQNESALHMTMKYYFEPDAAYHEQKFGSFFADIHRDGCITEIQTSKFYTMKSKLEYFFV